MISPSAALPNSYDYSEVGRSLLVAIAVSYAGFDLAGRVLVARGRARLAWLSGGAIAIGASIWAVQFKGILAFHLPAPIAYDWSKVLSSLGLAIVISALALYLISRWKSGRIEALIGGLLLGAGISGVHYLFIAAVRSPASTHFYPLLVAASVVPAIGFSWIALLLAFGGHAERGWTLRRRFGSATLMAVGLVAMRYTSIAATSFVPAPAANFSHAIIVSVLGENGGAIAALIAIAVVIVTSSVDRRSDEQVQQLNQALENRVAERTAQIRAVNAKLAESEERFRKLVEALPDAVMVHGENKILFVNPACMKLLGAQRAEQLLGMEVLEILHPDYREGVQKCIQYCLETGTACPAKESVFLALDGSEVQVEAAAIAVPWKGLQAVEVIVRDIRQRKHAEERLREYEKVVEGLEEMIVVVDRDYRYVLANRAFLDRRGMEREHLLGLTVPDVLEKEIFETVVKKKLDECFQGKAVTYEMKYGYPKLGARDLLIAYFPIEGPHGVDRVASVMRDLTERKKAESALRASEERSRRLVQNSSVAMIVSRGPEQKVELMNDRFRALFGYTIEDVPDVEHWWPLAYPDESYRRAIRNEWQARMEKAVRNMAEIEPLETMVRCKDGSTRVIEAYLACIGDTNLVTLIDLTERKRAEQSLQLFRMLIDQSNDAIEVIEPGTHRFLDANERACLDLGYSREELLSLSIYDIDFDASEARFAKVTEDLRNSGSVIFESFHRRKNGSMFPVEISVKQVHFDHSYRICVVRDITERKQAEKSLQLFRTLIDQSNDAIEVVDPHTLRYIDINERACIDLGYTREELLSMSIYEIDPNVDESMYARVHADLRDQGSAILESLHRRKDGTTFPVEVSITQVNLDRTYIVSVARDITERRRVEDELRRQKEVFQKIFENIPVMIAFFGEDGHFKLANPEWERTMGWTVEEIQKQNVDIFVELYPNPQYRQMARDFAASLSSGHADLKVKVRDGRVIDMAADVVRLSDGSRLGIGRDITEQRRTEAELRESEARFRLVADSAPVMIWMSGTDKLCTYFNKPWLEFAGRSIDDELGNGWAEGVHPGDLSRCVDMYTQSFDRREAFRMEYRLRRHDGEFRWVLDIGVPRFNPDRSFAGYIGSCIDVTDQRRAEEQLRQTQADLARITRVVSMGELVVSIAHEINQPLAAVVTNGSASLRWLAAQPPNLEEAREAIEGATREATRASDVIGRIRALLEKSPAQMQGLDLNAVIREVLTLAETELMRGGVSVQTELAADLPAVLGDPVQLRQVMLNLILNAIDATSEIADGSREVFVKSATHLDGVLVQVRDSGPGVAPKHVERIFDSLFTTKPQGIGVGLSLSRSIVEAHGGRLWTVPQPSRGAVFEFTIPKAD